MLYLTTCPSESVCTTRGGNCHSCYILCGQHQAHRIASINRYWLFSQWTTIFLLPKSRASYQNCQVFGEIRVSREQDYIKGSTGWDVWSRSLPRWTHKTKMWHKSRYQDWGLRSLHSKESKQKLRRVNRLTYHTRVFYHSLSVQLELLKSPPSIGQG